MLTFVIIVGGADPRPLQRVASTLSPQISPTNLSNHSMPRGIYKEKWSDSQLRHFLCIRDKSTPDSSQLSSPVIFEHYENSHVLRWTRHKHRRKCRRERPPVQTCTAERPMAPPGAWHVPTRHHLAGRRQGCNGRLYKQLHSRSCAVAQALLFPTVSCARPRASKFSQVPRAFEQTTLTTASHPRARSARCCRTPPRNAPRASVILVEAKFVSKRGAAGKAGAVSLKKAARVKTVVTDQATVSGLLPRIHRTSTA